jgi:ABC-2 type transport system permease protein
MNTYAYTRFELLRTFRSKRFFVMSLGFPLVIYLLIALPNRGVSDFAGTGNSAPLYYMVGLAAFGAMAAILSSGTRIAGERAVGWNRQLRITPLTTRAYLRTKVLTGYLMALLTVGLLYVAGSALGVRLPAADWLHMTLLMIVALIPLAALGILLGHLLTVDSIGPAVGGLTAMLAFVSGTWFPLGHGLLNDVGQCLPSYWLIQASHVALGGQAWPAKGWAVVAAWSVVLSALAVRAYRRDTQRV